MRAALEIPGIDDELWLEVHGLHDTCVSRKILENHIWEPYETELVVGRVAPGAVFVDVGANIGYYTVLASRLVGDAGRVVAYEPDEDNFALLERNLALNRCPNVAAFQAALSDRNAAGRIYLNEENRGDHQVYDSGEGRRERTIELVDAAGHLPAQAERVDFIKIDTQGAEAAIMRGLREVCRRNRQHLTIILEFWPYGLRQAGDSGMEVVEILRDLDMPCSVIDHLGFRLHPIGLDELARWVRETDATPDNQGFINLLVTPAAGA